MKEICGRVQKEKERRGKENCLQPEKTKRKVLHK